MQEFGIKTRSTDVNIYRTHWTGWCVGEELRVFWGALPGGPATPAGGHGEGAAAARGAPRELRGQGADVAQVPRRHGAGRAAGGEVAVQHLAVHHGLLVLLAHSAGSR